MTNQHFRMKFIQYNEYFVNIVDNDGGLVL